MEKQTLKKEILEEFKKVKEAVYRILSVYNDYYRKRNKYEKVEEKVREENKELKYFELEARTVAISSRLENWFGWRNSKYGIVQYCDRSWGGRVFSVIVKAKVEEVNKYKKFIKREVGLDKVFKKITLSKFYKDDILWWVKKERLNSKKIEDYLKKDFLEGKEVLKALEECYGERIKERFIKKFKKDWKIEKEELNFY